MMVSLLEALSAIRTPRLMPASRGLNDWSSAAVALANSEMVDICVSDRDAMPSHPWH